MLIYHATCDKVDFVEAMSSAILQCSLRTVVYL